jgi:DNA polymerase III delta prime subunit
MSDLATNFQQEMERIYEEAKAFGYRPGRFLQMVRGRGGVATARRFLEQTGTSTGLATLNEHQRLDLTVEALVLKPEYASLFTKQERAIARERLAALDYTAPWDAAADNEASPRANRFVWEEGDVEITWPDGTHRDSKGAIENSLARSSEENEVSHAIENTPHDGEVTLDSAGVQRLMAIFHRRFPSSFTDQNYIDAERAYKLMAAERMRELIGKEILGGYIERGEYDQAKAAIIKSCGGSFRVSPTARQSNNLLNQWDMRLLLNAPAQLMTGRLYDLLYGEGPFAQRFDAWVDVLATEKKPGVWPGATYFLMLHDPDAYIFIKPAQFGFFLKHTGLDQAWPVRPDAATYMRFLAAARQLLSSLASLGARDMIDTQSFIWTVHYYAERLAWIFQSNPDYYNLPGALNELDEIDWVVRQNAGDIHIGDIVYLWEAGANAGIVAVAHALTEVANLPPNEREQPFYRDATRFSGTEPRMMLRIDQVLSERLLRSDIANDSKLAAMAILKNPQGTNFKLTKAEAERLAALVGEAGSGAGNDGFMTGAEAGLNGEDQIRIALQAMIAQGGSATVPEIYAAVEARMNGSKLSQQGKDSLRTFINRDAVDRDYVHPYDGANPIWRITDAGRAWLETQTAEKAPQGGDEGPDVTVDIPSTLVGVSNSVLANWQKNLQINNDFVRSVANDYPQWLQATFGDQIDFAVYEQRGIAIVLRNAWIITCWFNVERGVYVRVPKPTTQQFALLERNFPPYNLKPRQFGNDEGYRFILYDEQDYAILKQFTRLVVEGKSAEWPPQPLDGSAFVLVHSGDRDEQLYGQSYVFSNRAGGAPMRLVNAIEEAARIGPASSIYILIYRPGPFYAFTGWARVAGFGPFSNGDEQEGLRRWKLTLDQHEFPFPVGAKSLTERISWLNKGLAVAFRGISIRQITPQEFAMIIDAARNTTVPPPAGYGGQDDNSDPTIYAEDDAQFWRIHFPRKLWNEAWQNDVIGVGFNDNPNDQSMKRFRRIKPGDRVVAYVQGGTIGSIGVVTQPYRDDDSLDANAARLFDGEYNQHIGVSWADTLSAPVSLLEELRASANSALYNRLKNPQTVIPISRDEYASILRLLGINDVGTPSSETRLPAAWTNLGSYTAFVQALEKRAYSAAELRTLAKDSDTAIAGRIDMDGLVDDLRRFRLLETIDEDRYTPRPYVSGDTGALLRLMALALLIPAEGTAATYELPVLQILPRLRAASQPQPLSVFAPELGADSQLLLEWYREAGLIKVDGASDTWQPAENALVPLAGDDPATQTYNDFLATAQAAVDGTLPTDLDRADGPLPVAQNFAERLRELSADLLFDERIVRRIYRSLMAGRHIVLSGPPGTGKTELAKRLPELLWREEPQTFRRITTNPDQPPVEERTEQRHGYAAIVVTATEDWGVRDIVGGIGPTLDSDKGLGYAIQHGALTRAVLQHYEGSDRGRRLPTQLAAKNRSDYWHDDRRRFRGAWLVIDEFTRAPIDAAFGSLLTTLSGGDSARLAVPTASGELRDVPVPSDFRIIGTLNSFDRHFLNQMSEALKRRFDFIDVLPPPPQYASAEQGVAAMRALRRLNDNGFAQIQVTGEPTSYHLGDIMAVETVGDNGAQQYRIMPSSDDARQALRSFWDVFRAIRVFRQLGTAQMVAVYTNLFAGVLVSMPWDEALDTALADSLADQLQVLNRDEQRIIDAYIEHAASDSAFANALAAIFDSLPPGRRTSLRYALREADQVRHPDGASDIGVSEQTITAEQLGRVFALGVPLALPALSIFRRRLRDLIGERGL